jgi:hypothetical protein
MHERTLKQLQEGIKYFCDPPPPEKHFDIGGMRLPNDIRDGVYILTVFDNGRRFTIQKMK